jgi:hypothetical protein
MKLDYKRIISSIAVACVGVTISILVKDVIPSLPTSIQPVITAGIVAISHYVDAWRTV